MKDSALPANPLDVDQVEFDNAEHRRAFYDALIASGRDKVMEDRRRLTPVTSEASSGGTVMPGNR